MLISVIMPVFNGLEYLSESIDSILKQSYQDFEFIIIDDASTEPVWTLLHSIRDKRLVLRRNTSNLGLTKSLNICLDLAHGDLFARHDGDDIALPNRFSMEVERFRGNIGLVSCWAKAIDSGGQEKNSGWEDRIARISAREVRRLLPVQNCVIAPGAMFSRKVFEKIGYFDESVRFAQDYNYWLRLLEYFDLDIVEEDLVLKRHHKENVWKKPGYIDWVKRAKERASIMKIIKKKIKFL